MNVMEERQKLIDGQFNDVANAQKDAEALKVQYEEKMRTAKEESIQIVEEARKNATIEYEAKIKDADEQTKKMIQRAQSQIELERDKTMQQMQNQIVTLAMQAAGKIVSERTDAASDRSQYESFLAKAGDTDDTDGQ